MLDLPSSTRASTSRSRVCQVVSVAANWPGSRTRLARDRMLLRRDPGVIAIRSALTALRPEDDPGPGRERFGLPAERHGTEDARNSVGLRAGRERPSTGRRTASVASASPSIGLFSFRIILSMSRFEIGLAKWANAVTSYLTADEPRSGGPQAPSGSTSIAVGRSRDIRRSSRSRRRG